MLKANCTQCGLHKTRMKVIFGDGDPVSWVMFVGEAPGEKEDIEGRPFVGLAGTRLWKSFKETTGKEREEVYVTNIVKCRPPDNRAPFSEEVEACSSFLKAEIEKNKPKVIFAFGKTAVRQLLAIKGTFSIKDVRRSGPHYCRVGRNILVIPAYHPSSWNRGAGREDDFRADISEVIEK